MEGTLVFLCVFSSVSASVPGIKNQFFNQSWPPEINKNRDALTVGNMDAVSALDCAGQCMRAGNCKSFLYKKTDKPQENCFNTETPQLYAGKINTALGGVLCHAWTSNHFYRNHTSSFPDGSMNAADNYCRDPLDPPDGFLWCPLGGGGYLKGVGWETCNIPRCMSTNCRLFNRTFVNSAKVKLDDDIVFFSKAF